MGPEALTSAQRPAQHHQTTAPRLPCVLPPPPPPPHSTATAGAASHITASPGRPLVTWLPARTRAGPPAPPRACASPHGWQTAPRTCAAAGPVTRVAFQLPGDWARQGRGCRKNRWRREERHRQEAVLRQGRHLQAARLASGRPVLQERPQVRILTKLEHVWPGKRSAGRLFHTSRAAGGRSRSKLSTDSCRRQLYRRRLGAENGSRSNEGCLGVCSARRPLLGVPLG